MDRPFKKEKLKGILDNDDFLLNNLVIKMSIWKIKRKMITGSVVKENEIEKPEKQRRSNVAKKDKGKNSDKTHLTKLEQTSFSLIIKTETNLEISVKIK